MLAAGAVPTGRRNRRRSATCPVDRRSPAQSLLRCCVGSAPSIVDVSLLAFGMWVNSPDIVISKILGQPVPKMTRDSLPNPIVNRYLTKDERLIQLVMLQAVRFWPELLGALGRSDLATDERFATPEAMFENRVEGTRLLDEIFATRTLKEWKDALADIKGVWSPVQQGLDLYDDVQVQANGYLGDAETSGGTAFQLVTNPVQFDEQPNTLVRAPELGEHTDDVLRACGLDDEAIIQLKIDNAIL
jgi:crotonobetainyl-CoA:carnitine CoA-transferase CaiB-like acyl-CoA transferase